MPPQTKRCTNPACDNPLSEGGYLPVSEFYTRAFGGLFSRCKHCTIQEGKRWKQDNADRQREYARESNRKRRAQRPRYVPDAVPDGYKQCNRMAICRQGSSGILPLDQFGRNNQMADGLNGMCNECRRHERAMHTRKRVTEIKTINRG